MQFRDFSDYWSGLANGHGNAPSYVRSLASHQQEILRQRIREALPTAADGTIALTARAWVVRGTRP